MGNMKFFICDKCGAVAVLIKDAGAPLVCCGDVMKTLVPNTAEASAEKHLPLVAAADGGIDVQIGAVPHPMEAKHHIEFVYVETGAGGQRKRLNAGDGPAASFRFAADKPVAVYAYCNLHGLWKTFLS